MKLRSAILPGLLVVAACGQAPAPPRFEVISVKPCKDVGVGSVQFNQPGEVEARGGSTGSGSPNRLSIGCLPLVSLIRMAYLQYAHDPGMPPLSSRLLLQAIPGSPSWISGERYAIDAKSETPQSSDTLHGPMLQAILEQRFGLKIHREAKETPRLCSGCREGRRQTARGAGRSVLYCRPRRPALAASETW